MIQLADQVSLLQWMQTPTGCGRPACGRLCIACYARSSPANLGVGFGGSGDRECAAALWAAVQRLTREQLAAGLLQLLAHLEQQARIACIQKQYLLGLPILSAVYG